MRSLSDVTSKAPLLLVGAGNMGGALLKGWLARGLKGAGVLVCDPGVDASAQSDWTAAGVRFVALNEIVSPPALVVLAVKPQLMSGVLNGVSAVVSARSLVLSVAAGCSLVGLARALPAEQPIVRVMPNTPSMVGAGMGVGCGNGFVTDDHIAMTTALMEAVGQMAWIDDEAHMDAVTAVSGSGPAYVFHLVEALAAAGEEQGLSRELAETLARQTVVGAGLLLAQSEDAAGRLRENVTSPNGTTAAALGVLMRGDAINLSDLMSDAVSAAAQRSQALSEE